jgi:hypothetical protein
MTIEWYPHELLSFESVLPLSLNQIQHIHSKQARMQHCLYVILIAWQQNS